MNKIAVDVGFGRVKAFSDSGQSISFPSVIGEFHPIRFTSGIDKDPVSNLAIGYHQKQYFVGESALKQAKPQATIDKERTVTEEGLVLLMGALSLIHSDKTFAPVNLILGLPVMHYDSLKDKYIEEVKREHIVENLSLLGDLTNRQCFVIPEIKVLPQPLGTFFGCLLNDEGDIVNSRLASERIGIIDIGHNTLDIAWVDSLEFINLRSTSFSGLGMFSAFQNLALDLYQNLGVEIPTENIEQFIRQGEIKISGRTISIEPYKKRAFSETAKQILSRVKSFWPDRWNLDQIIISGGGATLLGEYLLNEFQQAYIVSNPMYANASGYLKFGNRIWNP